MSSEGGKVMFECDGCGYDVAYTKRPKTGSITVCPRCAMVQVCLDEGQMKHVDAEMHKELPDNRIEAIDALIRTVQDTKLYSEWIEKSCEELLRVFSNEAMSRGLSIEQTTPAIMALLGCSAERMGPASKIKAFMEVMRVMGGTPINFGDEELNDERVNSGGGSA